MALNGWDCSPFQDCAMTSGADLAPGAFPAGLDWSPEKQEAALQNLYEFVMKECDSSIKWYHYKKGSKKSLGLWLRFLATLSVGAAG
jgi:hypothetical protein